MATTLFVAQLAATLVMTGVIWFVQVAHYPLFAWVGEQGFGEYEEQNTTRTGWVVGAPMLLEIGTAAVALFAGMRPEYFPRWAALAGAGLLGAIWISTAVLQVPLHRRLVRGFDPVACRRLVKSNWVRTICWSFRAALLLWVTVRGL